MPTSVKAPLPLFFDSLGEPLDNGQLYFGVVGQNPETSPIPVYWDSLATQPAAQPIRTVSGTAARVGAPSNVYVNSSYSLTVKNSRGELIYYLPNSSDYDSDATLNTQLTAVSSTLQAFTAGLASTSSSSLGDALVGVKKTFTSTIGRTQHEINEETVSVKDFYNPLSENISLGLQRAVDYVKTLPTGGAIFIPPGVYTPTSQVVIGNPGYDKYLTIYSNNDATFDILNFSISPFLDIGTATAQGNCNFVLRGVNVFSSNTNGKFSRARNANGARFFHNFIFDVRQVMDASDSFLVKFEHNHFRRVWEYVFVSSTACHGFKSINNLYYDCALGGNYTTPINLLVASDNIVVDNNTFEGCRTVMFYNGGTSISFSKNYMEYFGASPITSNGVTYGFSFSENWINGDNGSGGKHTWTMPKFQGGKIDQNNLVNIDVTYQGDTFDGYLHGNKTYNATLPPVPMQPATLLNSHVGDLRFTKINGVVYLAGRITTGSNTAQITTLPVEYRPSRILIFYVYGDSPSQWGSLTIEPSGAVKANHGHLPLAFDSVSFLVSA